MVVLFKTRKLSEAQEIERDLIWHTAFKNANRLPGGEGLRPGKPWYYIYTLIEPASVEEEAESSWPLWLGLLGFVGLVAVGARGSR